MRSLAENLYCSLSALPQAEVSAQGERLVHEIWPRAPKLRSGQLPAAQGRLVATDGAGELLAVETVAFNNAFRFAEQHCKPVSEGDVAAELACVAAPVFAAMALAEARGADHGSLLRAVGLGAEAYARLARGLGNGTRSRGFDARVISAALAAIVACASIEKLSSDKAAQALGLGSSAVTGNAIGYLPLQVASAARDGIVMALLMSCGFRGPLDPLACRWGVYEVFADANDIGSLDVNSRSVRAAGDLHRIFGNS